VVAVAERPGMGNCPPVVVIEDLRVLLVSRVFRELQNGGVET
jgi:hypothetical protein